MLSRNRTGQEGLSVIEVVIVVAVLGILASLAVVRFQGATTDMERQKIVRELKNYLERARFDSVKRRSVENDQMATITLTSATGFTAALDLNSDGRLTAGERRVVSFDQRANTRVYITDTLNYPITIRFNQRGQASAVDSLGTGVTPLFKICSNCSSASPQVSYISISPAGTIADSRSAPTALPTPSVSNVSNPSLNCYVLVTNSNSGCRLF